jgi:AdoMet-dependent heme synthase
MKSDIEFKEHLKRVFLNKFYKYKSTQFTELGLTNECHNKCFYCGTREDDKKNHHVSFEKLTQFIDEIVKKSCETGIAPSIALTGGDVLLYPQLNEVIELLYKRAITFSVKANPSSLTRQHIKFLREKGCTTIRFTLAGTPELHEKRRGKNTFKKLIKLTKLASAYGLKVHWNITVGEHNVSEITDMLPYISAIRPDTLEVGRIARIGLLKWTRDYKELNAQKFRSFLMEILTAYYQNYKTGFSIGFKEKLWFPLLIEEGLLSIEDFQYDNMVRGCEAYCGSLSVNHMGEIQSCSLSDVFKIGTLNSADSIAEVIRSRPVVDIKKESPCHGCKYSNFCRGCRAIAYENTGDLYAQDPQCWLEDIS